MLQRKFFWGIFEKQKRIFLGKYNLCHSVQEFYKNLLCSFYVFLDFIYNF